MTNMRRIGTFTTRNTVLLTLSAMLAATAAGCGGGASNDAKAGNETAAKDPVAKAIEEAASKKVTIGIYEAASDYTSQNFMDDHGTRIQQKFPNFSFDAYGTKIKLDEMVAAGTAIDLVKSNPLSMDLDLHGDISDMTTKYKYDTSKMNPEVLKLMLISGKGKLLGLPNAIASVALFYNKDLFDKFGVPYPTDKMTWDDAYELAKRMTRTDGGVQYRGLGINFANVAQMNQLSQSFVDPNTNKATFNNDNWKLLFNTFGKFFEIPGNTYSTNASKNFYEDGNTAMFVGLSGGSYNTASAVNWDIAALPTFKEKPGVGPGAYIAYYYLTKTSKNRDQAFLTLREIVDPDYRDERALLGYVSPYQSKVPREKLGTGDPKLAGKKIYNVVPEKFADPYPMSKYHNTVAGTLNSAFTEVATGKKDVNTALREAQEKADQLIATQLGAAK